MQAMRRPWHSSHPFLDPVPLHLLSRHHHSSAPASPERYGNRYEDRFLLSLIERPKLTYQRSKPCMLATQMLAGLLGVRLEGFEPPTRGLGKRDGVLHRIAEDC